MANKKEKSLRRIKKNHAWVSMLLFFLVTICTVGILAFLLDSFVYYVMDAKILDEYESIEYMAKLYDTASESNDGIYNLLNEEGRSYLILDDQNRILYQHGKNTCSIRSGTLELSRYSDQINVYVDSEIGFLYPSSDRTTSIDIVSMLNELDDDSRDEEDLKMLLGMKPDGEFEYAWDEIPDGWDGELNDSEMVTSIWSDTDEEGTLFDKLMEIDRLELPIWIALDVKDGTQKLVGKASISFDMKEVFLVVTCITAIGLLLLVILVIMLVHMISSLVGQKRLLKLFLTDVVTKGNNYMWFLIRGEQFLRKKSEAKNQYAVLNLTIVKYNNYCVCHSLEEGEKILCKVHDLLVQNLQKKEMCAHAAAAEFPLLLKYTDDLAFKMRIQEMLLQLEKIDAVHNFRFHVGVCILGVETDKNGKPVRRKNINLEKEYNNACAAVMTLEASDDSGIAFFDEKLVEEQKWIDSVQEKQRAALEREEFQVYYQPKYDPKTEELRGAEALIRWQSPELGFVSPGRFIPIFEKNGFITEIDHYMIRHAARDQKAWLDQGYHCVPVSVNVSRAHFIETDLAEQIRDMVDQEGTPHDLIEIELTESAFFDDKKALVTTIKRLKEYGFSVSMDDFGSGYSSLNSLKDMPLDVLKLDAEFFRGETEDGRGEIVVSEAIQLAKNLNMRIVAEGVEVKEQVDFLARQDCDMIQGYYFSKPLPKDEYQQRMHNQTTSLTESSEEDADL